MPMRVYECAKKFNISNKKLIDLLAKKGYEVSTHMSALPEGALDEIEEFFAPEEKKKSAPKATAPIEKKVRQKKEKKPKKIIKKEEEKSVESEDIFLSEMPLSTLAEKINKPASEVILFFLRQGHAYPKNQVLTIENVQKVLDFYQIPYKVPEKRDEDVLRIKKDVELGTETRLPIIAVVGHVDHGKTTLLDYIRNTRVVAKEKGGITQHLGAYEAKTPQGNLVFLDTPGHAAFSKMRARGVKAADIVILVVAADDSVMPQTVEAIKYIKELDVPAIVAINKADRVEPSQIEKVKRDLAQYDLLPEDWGGQTVCVPISALKGEGVDQLLEMIVLQSQIMDLKADPDRPAEGFVLESRLEKGRGPVATVICQHGTLRVGDYFGAGHTFGRVTSLVDSFGDRLKEVGPSLPVQVAGFDSLPDAGDFFEVVSKEKYRSIKASKGAYKTKFPRQKIDEDAVKLVFKVDTNSTKEALLSEIEKIGKKLKRNFHVVYAGVGNITESDISLATDTGSIVYGLHVKVEPGAALLAKKNLIVPRLFDIIYKCLENLEETTKPAEEVKKEYKKIGEANVLKVFDIKNIGVIAGCYLVDGRFSKDGTVEVWRGKQKIGEGKIKSLQRERKPVKEVHAGFEFGVLLDGFNDFQVDDRLECHLEVPVS